MTKTEFDNKLTSFHKRITSNKANHLKVETKPESLITKDYSFFKVEYTLQVMMDYKICLFMN